MTQNKNLPQTPGISGYGIATEKHTLHLTAQIAGAERHYILPAKEFSRFIAGHTVTGINRDLLNEIGTSDETFSVQFSWDHSLPVMQDLLHDPLGDSHVSFRAGDLADVFFMNRLVCFADGPEKLRDTARVEDEVRTVIKKEIYKGYVPAVTLPARYEEA